LKRIKYAHAQRRKYFISVYKSYCKAKKEGKELSPPLFGSIQNPIKYDGNPNILMLEKF
jgi:hypothetical protein